MTRSLPVCGLALSLLLAGTTRAATTITVTSNADAGAHTLRQAILDANADPSPDPVRIIFSIGSGAASIAPASALPAITRPVIVDGTTQLGFTGAPLIELRGDAAGGGADGLLLTGHTGSTVRGLVINRFKNDVNGNGGFGIEVPVGSNGHLIAGNYLGTDATGAVAAGNSRGGILIRGNDVTVGGTTAASRNVIAGNGSFGLLLLDGSGTTVSGNYLGVSADGTTAVTSGDAIYAFDPVSNLTIGGVDSGAGNVIVASGAGINLHDTPGIVVRGNWIGTTAAGTTAIGGGLFGVYFYSVTGATVHDNVIGGMSAAAIALQGGTQDVSLKGNHIGVDASGAVPLPLGSLGISVEGLSPFPSDVTIGGIGAGEGNIITNCAIAGISLLGGSSAPTRITIRGNRITGNGGLGIDLEKNGVSPNDPDDADGASNDGQNFPVLTTAQSSATGTTIGGTLSSLPNATYTIDFYASDAADASGYGEGTTYVGSATLLIDGTGTGGFGIILPTIVTPGTVITATATDAAGSTSEFSAAYTVTGGATSTTTSITGTTATSTTTTVVSTSTTTTLHCATTGLPQILCLLHDLPPSSCNGESLPAAVTNGLQGGRTLLTKAQAASAKKARRLEKRSAARLKKAGAKLAKAAQHQKVGAPCASELGASLQQIGALTAGLLAP